MCPVSYTHLGGQRAERAEEPDKVHAADEGHDDENEDVLQCDAEVFRRGNDEHEQEDCDAADLQDRRRGGELVLLDAHDLGKNEDERNFTELGGLDAEGEEAEIQPAAVALLCVAPFEEEGDEDRAEQEQQLAPLGDDVNVDQREQDVACLLYTSSSGKGADAPG